MKLEDWSNRNGDLGGWSHRQPLEPAPTFKTRAVAAGWDYMERYALHLVRRGVEVPPRLAWFRAVDNGWEDPTGLVAVIMPHHELLPHPRIFRLTYSLDADACCREMEREGPYPLEVFQAWPGCPGLADSLNAHIANLRRKDGWCTWVQADVMQLVTAMDIVCDAWAHRRYWFGLEPDDPR